MSEYGEIRCGVVDGVATITLHRPLLWSMLGAGNPWEAHRLDSRAISRVGHFADVVPPWPVRPDNMP